MSKYTCPACNQGFDKINKGHCPNCDKELKFVRGYDREQKKLTHRYELPVAEEDELPRTLTNPGQNPEIELLVKASGDVVAEYRVTFRNIMHMDWVYCPHCQSKMFENMVIQGNFSQNHKCRNCKSMVDFVFTTT